MNKNIEIEYGFNLEGKLVHVKEVKNGLSCNCKCPNCGVKLIAVNNLKNKTPPHFRHYSSELCNNYHETIIHLLAKEIIEKEKKIALPNMEYSISENASTYYEVDKTTYFPKITSQKVSIDQIIVEKREGNLQPDLIGFISGKKFYIEIAVTHFIDKEKKVKLEKKNIPTIEINLSDLERKVQYKILKEIIINDITRKKWIVNEKNKIKLDRFISLAKEIESFIKLNQRTVKVYGKRKMIYNCPKEKNKNTKIPLTICDSCKYHLSTHISFDPNNPKGEDIEDEDHYVDCIGHKRYEFDKMIKNKKK